MNSIARHVAAIGTLKVLYVMATPHEYGPHLRARMDPLITGVGPVEAAAATAHALSVLAFGGRLPDLVFAIGSAGSRRLDHAEIYQMARVGYRDMDASALGFEKGVTPFADHPATIEIPHRIAGLPAASLSTGGSIISGPAYEAIEADMVDMESFAVLRAAERFGVPTIGLRGISDGRSAVSRLEDWTEYLALIDERLAIAVGMFEAQVLRGEFALPRRPEAQGRIPSATGDQNHA